MEERAKAIALACRLDSERAINLTKKIFNFLIKKKSESVYLETRIAPRILPTNLPTSSLFVLASAI